MKQPAPATPRPAEADKYEQNNAPLQGEGNYKASRNYVESVKRFLGKGQVDAAARAARPRDGEEEAEMKAAEKTGLSRSRH